MCVCTTWQTEEGSTEKDGLFIPHCVSMCFLMVVPLDGTDAAANTCKCTSHTSFTPPVKHYKREK